MDQAIKAYGPLVRAIAFRIVRKMPPDVEVEDLISIGNICLIHLLQKDECFPKEYIASRIYFGILEEMREQDPAPRSLRRKEKLLGRRLVLTVGMEEAPQLAANSRSPFSEYELKEVAEKASAIIETFNERERIIMDLHYNEEISLRVIASKFKVHESLIGVIHKRLIARLKKKLDYGNTLRFYRKQV